jgi:2-amino-4-hydroxy-6-hydroxymethyldihydropteridine diphosphokinase
VTRYAIGLGSNLGDRLYHLTSACSAIEDKLGSIIVSSLYETEPVGGPEQGAYLNAVVLVETSKDPDDVLSLLQDIEMSQGRERSVRWGARTLDLDIVAGPARDTERLTIPHPRAAEREFVLRPLVEVWPEAPLGDGLTASIALNQISGQGVDRLVPEWLAPVSRATANGLLAIQFTLIATVGVGVVVEGTMPRELGVWVGAGGAMAAMGLVLALWASVSLGPAMTASPLPKPGTTLVTLGPYRLARHPMYGGLFLFLMGCALVAGSLLAVSAAALLVPLFLVKAGYEERRLRMIHPQYRSYMEEVPRLLIPFVF